MRILRDQVCPFHCLILALFFPLASLQGATVFDSFTPPNTEGGFSSANAGNAIQISATSDLTIAGISVLNEMLAPGNLRFVLYSYPQPNLLLLTDPIAFPADAPGVPTWKDSSPVTFSLTKGNQYLVGYVRDVGVQDVGDRIAESGGGVTSDLFVHCILGFQIPTYSHACIGGMDLGARLQAASETLPPTILCPGPLVLECSNGWAIGTLQAEVTDTNGNPVSVVWTVDGVPYQTNDIPSGGSITASNVTFTANYGSGEHTVVVSASNDLTEPAGCSTTVTVGDTLPPTVSQISVTPSSLWPPNHRMVSVSVVVNAADNCDPSPVAHIAHVTSNEPQNPFTPDWEITGPLSVNLRAERSGSKGGRIYTIVVECEDGSGNVAYASVDVAVPHDHR